MKTEPTITDILVNNLEFRANLPSTSCFYRPEPGWLLRC
jgi:hypothetical protein